MSYDHHLNRNVNTDHWEFEGDLYCKRLGYTTPLRTDYSRHHRVIKTGKELRSSLRAGAWAWPGGYDIGFITDDGGLLCHGCVKAELYNITHSIRNECSDGWRVIGSDVIHEHDTCSHCNKSLGLEEEES